LSCCDQQHGLVGRDIQDFPADFLISVLCVVAVQKRNMLSGIR
jgi:hypothetical protein